MKIVCISDTHNCYPELPDGDILIHAGDATIQGTISEASQFAQWWDGLPHKHKIFVAGNHDWLWQKQPSLAETFVKNLQDSFVEIEGLKIYGASWQPWFHDWAFNLQRGKEIKAKWDLIPEGMDIIVTHGPAFGALDEAPGGLSAGCRDLLDAIKRVKPKLHVCGHIHHSYGQIDLYGTKFVNASICDEAYVPNRPPIVIEL